MIDDSLRSDLCALTDLARVVCLAPFLDRQQVDPETEEEAREMLLVAQEIKARLDDVLTDDVRADLVQLIGYLEENRNRYRAAMLRWVDLLEDLAFTVENRYGDGTGPMKLRQVRAALYYVLKGFMGQTGLPTISPWARPIMLEIAVRATVEYLVTLDNPMSNRPMLWADASREGTYRPLLISKQAHVKIQKWRESTSERVVAWLIRILLPPPSLKGELRKDVDAILADWEARDRRTGTKPFERMAKPVVETANWIGDHGDQVRAAIDVVALSIYETSRLAALNHEQQLEVVKEAVVMMFQDFGYTGPIFETVVRFMVDMTADATQHLFAKRGLIGG